MKFIQQIIPAPNGLIAVYKSKDGTESTSRVACLALVGMGDGVQEAMDDEPIVMGVDMCDLRIGELCNDASNFNRYEWETQ